jgi:hypothetical protein
MRPRPTRSTRFQRRRHRAATLALVGLALMAVGIFGRSPHGAQLDARSQDVRMLPVPTAPNAHARVTTASVRVKPPKPRGVRRVWRQLPPPARISIPAIGVSASMIPLGQNTDGTVQTPSNTVQAGWYTKSPGPGEQGAALVVGHVDSYRGPGVFFHLRALRRGDLVNFTLRNGQRVRFVVTGSKDVSKSKFPAALVYAHTATPTLRLVTCGGRFDRSTGHYLDNYIVFARLAGT